MIDQQSAEMLGKHLDGLKLMLWRAADFELDPETRLEEHRQIWKELQNFEQLLAIYSLPRFGPERRQG